MNTKTTNLLFAFALSVSLFLGYSANAQTYVQSNFESGEGGWTTNNSSQTCQGTNTVASTWALASSCGGLPISLGSTCFGTPNDGSLGAENSWILSPEFTPNVGSITVDFDSWTSNETGFPCNFDVEIIEITQDGGSTWTPIHGEIENLHTINNDQVWRHFSLTANVTASQLTQIRFRYDTGDDYSGSSSSGWYLDNIKIKPTINFDVTQTEAACINSTDGTIAFAVTAGTAPFEYSIDNGVTFQTSANFSSVAPGNYVLNVKDGLANISDPVFIQINAATVVVAELSCNYSSICQGQEALMNAYNETGYSYRWLKNDTFISLPDAPNFHNALQDGLYSVHVSKDGCMSVSNSVYLVVHPAPTVSMSSVSNTCVGKSFASINFNIPNTGTEPFEYSIDNGATFSFSPSYQNLVGGEYLATIKDALGCSSNTETVTLLEIVDTIAPIILTKDVIAYLNNDGDAQIVVSDIDAGTTDNCATPVVSVFPTTFNATNLGNNTVTLTATDENENSSSAIATVTIIDTIAPTVFTNSTEIYLDANGTATLPVEAINNMSFDNGGIISLSASKTLFSCDTINSYTVLLTATDASGNSTSASSEVSVLDTIKPTAIVFPQIDLILDSTGFVSLEAKQVNNGSYDNCSIVNYSINQTSFTKAGAYTVTLSVTDLAGNTSTHSTTVNVIDNIAPTIIVKNITRNLPESGMLVLTAQEIDSATTDIAGISSITLNTNTLTCSNIGLNSILFTATDNNGNSNSKTVYVTLLDNIAPTAVAQNISITLGALDTATIAASNINNGSTDNCGIATMSIMPATFTIAQVGLNTVSLSITDNSGNISTATANVTVFSSVPTSTVPVISFTNSNTVTWSNVPSVTNNQSTVITNTTQFNTVVGSLKSIGGNLKANGNSGIGVHGGSLTSGCIANTTFLDTTINKNQSVIFSLADNTIGITKLVFASGITAKINIIGKRNGQQVVSFSKLMIANRNDTFNFNTACLMRGMCTVDEVEFKLSNKTTNCKRNWNQNSTSDYNDNFEDGVNFATNCAFTIKNASFFVEQKDTCKIGDIPFSWNARVYAGDVVATSGNISLTASNIHSLGSNSDGNLATGSPNISNPVKRIAIGYNWLGFPSAWEINNDCSVRNIRQGMFTNTEALPVGNLLNLFYFDYTITSIDANGQYIYGKRKSKSNNATVDIRWKVNEYFQRIWISNPTIVSFGKRGIEETEQEELLEDATPQSQVLGDLTIAVYPNPSNSQFTFNVTSDELTPISIEVSDMAGRMVYSATNLQANQDFTIGSDLVAGVYVAHVKQGNTIKLMKITKVN